MDKSHCVLQLMKRAGLDPDRVKPLIRYQASDSATILAMVREGLGITLVPRTMLPKKLEGMVALPLEPSPQLRIGLAVRSQGTASPAATLFIQSALDWTEERRSSLAVITRNA